MIDLDPTEVLGYAAAGLVLATFSARSLRALRSLAIASNLLFIAYAASAGLMPVLVLHALLLPLNALRLHQALAEAPGALDQPLQRSAALARNRSGKVLPGSSRKRWSSRSSRSMRSTRKLRKSSRTSHQAASVQTVLQ